MNDFTKEELNILIYCATRYALGRSTYVVSTICDILINQRDNLHPKNKKIIKDEIEHAINHGRAGMKMDEEEWKKVLNAFDENRHD